jgi:hypothetical protein
MDSDIDLARSAVDDLNRFDMRIKLFPLAAPVGRQRTEADQVISWTLFSARKTAFVQITPNFPEPCRHVLEALGEVYHQDRLALQVFGLANSSAFS